MKKNFFILFGFLIEGLFSPFFVFSCLVSRCCLIDQQSHIFIGMMHVNNWTYVAKALRRRGYKVQVVPWIIPDHERGVIPYDVDLKANFPRLYSNFLGQYFLSFGVFIWALFKFNVFVIPFRSRLLDRTVWLKWFEIPLLHLAGKKVILNTYGGDVATPRLKRRKDLKYSLYDGYAKDPQYMAYDEKAIARNTRVVEKQADCIISAIDHVDYLKRVDHYFHLRCIDTDTIEPHYQLKNKVPLFVHAPNHRLLKGTDTIIEVIKRLNERGFPCELKIVENTPQSELMDIIAKSDGVIDQLILGTYARLAIEAMALGKPVFCYLRKDLYEFNPIWEHCPIINVDPDILEKELEIFLTKDKKKWVEIGKAGRHYVESFHSLEYVGQRFDKIIQETLKK